MEYVVEFSEVKKKYTLGKTEVHALQGVSFRIRKGDFVSIVGPSGSGKSTILNLIGCVDVADGGVVSVLEKDTATLNDAALTGLRHKGLGFIFQTFNLVPVLNVRENIELPLLLDKNVGRDEKKRRAEWVEALIDAVDLRERVAHKPAELSGGQRQRVAIARALVMRPPLVLADEPTANLDSKTSESIIRLMRQINSEFGTSFIFSTHDKDVVSKTDHVISIRDGLVVADSASGAVADPAAERKAALV